VPPERKEAYHSMTMRGAGDGEEAGRPTDAGGTDAGEAEAPAGAGDWEAAAVAVQAAALDGYADDARWRLQLLAKMAPSVQQRRPGRTGAWGCAPCPELAARTLLDPIPLL